MISKRRLVVVKRQHEEKRENEIGRRSRNILLPLFLLVLPQWWFILRLHQKHNFSSIDDSHMTWLMPPTDPGINSAAQHSYIAHTTDFNTRDLDSHHHTARNENQLKVQSSNYPNFTVDIVSIGSKLRKDFQQAQEETFASHTIVRNFFPITEMDDYHPNCSEQLSMNDTFAIRTICRSKEWHDGRFPPVADRIRNHFLLRGLPSRNAPGWLCAQRRPARGLTLAMRDYQRKSEDRINERANRTKYEELKLEPTSLEWILPDYLLIIDDDTYYNMEYFAKYFFARQNSTNFHDRSDGWSVTTPCLFTSPWRYPHGGFGSIWSRGMLTKLMEPVRCSDYNASSTQLSPAEKNQCYKILEENGAGERDLFREGMSVLDLMEAYSRQDAFVDHSNWKVGYCMHSDMFLGYFLGVLTSRISPRFNTKLWDIAFPKDGSERGSILCDKQYSNCDKATPVCHYQGAQDMLRLFRDSQSEGGREDT